MSQCIWGSFFPRMLQDPRQYLKQCTQRTRLYKIEQLTVGNFQWLNWLTKTKVSKAEIFSFWSKTSWYCAVEKWRHWAEFLIYVNNLRLSDPTLNVIQKESCWFLGFNKTMSTFLFCTFGSDVSCYDFKYDDFIGFFY